MRFPSPISNTENVYYTLADVGVRGTIWGAGPSGLLRHLERKGGQGQGKKREELPLMASGLIELRALCFDR